MPYYVIFDGDEMENLPSGAIWWAGSEEDLGVYLNDYCDEQDKEPTDLRIAEVMPSRKVSIERQFDIEKKRKK